MGRCGRVSWCGRRHDHPLLMCKSLCHVEDPQSGGPLHHRICFSLFAQPASADPECHDTPIRNTDYPIAQFHDAVGFAVVFYRVCWCLFWIPSVAGPKSRNLNDGHKLNQNAVCHLGLGQDLDQAVRFSSREPACR
jgi:hypothetical protein